MGRRMLPLVIAAVLALWLAQAPRVPAAGYAFGVFVRVRVPVRLRTESVALTLNAQGDLVVVRHFSPVTVYLAPGHGTVERLPELIETITGQGFAGQAGTDPGNGRTAQTVRRVTILIQ